METYTDLSVLGEEDGIESLVKAVDLVCVTDWDRDGLVSPITLFGRDFTHSIQSRFK